MTVRLAELPDAEQRPLVQLRLGRRPHLGARFRVPVHAWHTPIPVRRRRSRREPVQALADRGCPPPAVQLDLGHLQFDRGEVRSRPTRSSSTMCISSSLEQSQLRALPSPDGGVPQGSGGVTYIVSGGGGNGLNAFTISEPSWSAFREATYEHVKVTVSPAALVSSTRCQRTPVAIFDSVTISAPPPPVGRSTGP